MPIESSEKHEIATTAAAGDASSHPTLDERRTGLVRFIRTRVRDVEDAEDVVQDVMYQFFRAADAGTAIEDVTAWLFRSARNRVVDWYRKRKLESLPNEDEAIAEDAIDPHALAESSELWEAFLRALDDLPEEQRDVFILHELEGIPFSEIAVMTGVNQNTLLSRKRYAVLALRKKLKPYR